MGREVPDLAPEAERRLAAYDWPGNVRELQNVLERAIITARDAGLDLERVLPAPAPADPRVPDAAVLRTDELRELERRNILRALEATGWKVAGEAGAANLLGIKPSTLASRMKALGISRLR
jgi:transcriptional regulator with GAF, ATPase, and Fis domain